MWTVRMQARCMDCEYAMDIESISVTAAMSKLGQSLITHTQQEPKHAIKVIGQERWCTLEEHMDAAMTAVACKCQCKCEKCQVG